MSARNYLSAKENRFDCLPSISQKASCKGPELPPLSATANISHYNRNLYSSVYNVNSYMQHVNTERVGTPYSDFFSESETGTPDFRSEESDSSSGSALQRSNAEATRILSDEWERIERTLYDEDGEKSTRPQIVEECKQWRALHPQLRVVGRALPIPDKKPGFRPPEYDEVLVIHYSDYSEFSESDERLSQSSTDVTPQNSPRPSVCENLCVQNATPEKQICDIQPKLSREKISIYTSSEGDGEKIPIHSTNKNEKELQDTFCSLLHITPLQARSPSYRKRHNPSILKSEMASSRWMKNSRPDSSINCDRNSAKSFVSLDPRTYGSVALSASERSKMFTGRVLTARHRDIARLEPLYTPDLPPEMSRTCNSMAYSFNMRKVSLPPLMLEEEKKKVVHSAQKRNKPRKNVPKSVYQMDRMRNNK